MKRKIIEGISFLFHYGLLLYPTGHFPSRFLFVSYKCMSLFSSEIRHFCIFFPVPVCVMIKVSNILTQNPLKEKSFSENQT